MVLIVELVKGTKTAHFAVNYVSFANGGAGLIYA